MGDAQPGAVHRNELVDLALQAVEEQALHAAQVAEAFFADVGDEGDGARRLDVRLVQRANHGEHDREAAAIVADAGAFHDVAFASDFDVGAFRENRVEVRAEDQVGMRGLAGTDADDVAGLIDANIVQTEFLEEPLEFAAADLLFERRRGNLAEPRLQSSVCGSLR